eukprot:10121218-Heterocapsa_arctica.AAC.1
MDADRASAVGSVVSRVKRRPCLLHLSGPSAGPSRPSPAKSDQGMPAAPAVPSGRAQSSPSLGAATNQEPRCSGWLGPASGPKDQVA